MQGFEKRQVWSLQATNYGRSSSNCCFEIPGPTRATERGNGWKRAGEGSLSNDVLGHQGVNALEDVDGSVNVLRVDAKAGFPDPVETRAKQS